MNQNFMSESSEVWVIRIKWIKMNKRQYCESKNWSQVKSVKVSRKEFITVNSS